MDIAKTTKLVHFTTASNVALFGSYMAALFASAEGNVAATSIEAAQNQALLAHPHLADDVGDWPEPAVHCEAAVGPESGANRKYLACA